MDKTTWQRVKLGEIAESIVSGGTPLTSKSEYYNGAIPWLNTKEVKNNRIYFTEKTITEFGLANSSAKWIEKDSVIVAMYGATAGKVAINKIPLTTNQACCNITLDANKADYNFIYYTLLNSFEKLEQMTSGAAQQNLNVGLISNFSFSLPPLETQQRIAEILSSLDDKIDLLHRQNKTLESLALTLFRHTFIDNPNRNAWEEVTLNDICLKIASGGTPSTRIKEYYSGKINWYSTKELDDNFLFDSIQTITEAGLENSSAKLFPKDTIIIAIYAAPTVGRLGILTQDSAFNQAACGLIIDETKCSKEFVFCFLKNERENLNLLASGSAQQNLNVEKIKRYTLFLPDKITFNDFQIQAKEFFDKIYNNYKQIQNLESLRDIMLQKLLSGEMEIKGD